MVDSIGRPDIAVVVSHGRKHSAYTDKIEKINGVTVFKSKRKRVTFMGTVRGLCITTAMLIAISGIGTSVAYATNANDVSAVQECKVVSMVSDESYSAADAIKAVRNTITSIRQMLSSGVVSEDALKGLANDIYRLEKNADVYTLKEKSDIAILLNDADSLVKGMHTEGANAVSIATSITRVVLGIESESFNVEQSKASAIKSFSDVPTTHWAHKAIMDMANRGLIAGTTTPVNGVGTFAPDATMTRAQFLTVIVRAVYPNEAKDGKNGETWWQPSYNVAIDKGLLTENEFDFGDMNKPCTRQEMSLLLVRAYEKQGGSVDKLVPTENIADWSTIGTYYKDYVRKAYSLGMLCGVDSKGTFSPKTSLNRAQAATVLLRLVDESSRQSVDFTVKTTTSTVTTPVGQTQTWKEGQSHGMPKAGDTVIKSDGTKVVLKVGYGGVLGAGQGVDIYSGFVSVNGSVDGKNASGQNDRSKVLKDSITGETHTKDEWNSIETATSPKNANGTAALGSYIGEVRNTWFTWNGFCWESAIPVR